MTATLTAADAAATALSEALPLPRRVRAQQASSDEVPESAMARSIVATFVGSPSCELALAIAPEHVVVPAEAGVSFTDLVTPALEAATAALGSGVLSAAVLDDATPAFEDPEATVYALLDETDTAIGWFSLRVRPTARVRSSVDIAAKLGRIREVEMALTVEIGRTRIAVRDVLGLEPGAIVELDRSAGAPADVLLNGRIIAQGEVVVVDQDYAVRITRILDVHDGAR